MEAPYRPCKNSGVYLLDTAVTRLPWKVDLASMDIPVTALPRVTYAIVQIHSRRRYKGPHGLHDTTV